MEFHSWLSTLSPSEQLALRDSLKDYPKAAPQEGPQTDAFNSPADVVGFGGAAGGGKSGLAALMALHSHERTVIFRREKSQMKALIDDLVMFHGSDAGLNRQDGVFRFGGTKYPKKVIEWSGLSQPGDENVWRGRPHDLIVFDEATEIPFNKIKFVIGWLRSTTPGQRCRILMTFNPPSTADNISTIVEASQMSSAGRWVVDYFGPWLNERHPDPAMPGEIRWFYRNEHDEEIEKKNGLPESITIRPDVPPIKVVPQSRTFIPSLVTDNRYLRDTGYVSHLASLEEPHRSQMLLGDFRSGIVDSETQLIKSEWVDDAMDRWESKRIEGRSKPMDCLGVDVSRGGNNFTVIARRHNLFFWDKMIRMTGQKADDGPSVAREIIEHHRDNAEVCIDIIGPGVSPYDILRNKPIFRPLVRGINGAVKKGIPQPELGARMFNMRTACWWILRKILDPRYGCEPAIPKDNRLRSDLLAPRFEVENEYIKLESKLQIIRRLGHSPDDGDALAYSVATILDDETANQMIGRKDPVLGSDFWDGFGSEGAMDDHYVWLGI